MTTKTVAGASWIAPSSSSTESLQRGAPWILLGAFLLCGLAAVALHAGFRWPMHLPGRQGLAWMALLVLARLASSRAWSGSFIGASAGGFSMLPVFGFHGVFGPVSFVLSGVVFDAFCRALPRLPRALRMPLAGAVAMTAAGTAGLVLGEHAWMATAGAAATYLLSHFAFGLAGGGLGVALGGRTRRRP